MIYLPQKNYFYQNRFYFLIAVFILCLLGLVARIGYLTIINQPFLKKQGDARTTRIMSIPAYRGMITDRNGASLAVSTPIESLWIDPKNFAPTPQQLQRLSTFLNTSPQFILTRIKLAKQRDFIYLARGLEPALTAEIKQLKIPGIYVQKAFRRFYPDGVVTAHLLGWTDIDDKGQEGLELAFQKTLEGIPGKQKVIRDREGHIAVDLGVLQKPQPGQHLTLSIDRRIQYIAYRELENAMKKFKAVSASAVVLDVNSGEVLAMVNQPTFNPNQRPLPKLDDRFRNRAVTDLFEPGSVIKPFSVANALESGQFTMNSKINTSPGVMTVEGNIIREIDHHDYGVLDPVGILKHSSNVGVAKLTLALPSQRLWNFLHRIGFGSETQSHFPGERSGLMPNYKRWRLFDLATLSFGYGVAVTPLQLAQAYAVFANGGKRIPVSLLKIDHSPKGDPVISKKLSKQMRQILTEVVENEDGGAKRARVKGYYVAGKTGTARMLGHHGYEEHHHIASFVGFAPATRPRLVIAVVLHDPQTSAYYASQIAAPVFSSIMESSLTLLNIPPDHV